MPGNPEAPQIGTELSAADREDLKRLREEELERDFRELRYEAFPRARWLLAIGFDRTLRRGQEIELPSEVDELSDALKESEIHDELSPSQKVIIMSWLKEFKKTADDWRNKNLTFFVYREADTYPSLRRLSVDFDCQKEEVEKELKERPEDDKDDTDDTPAEEVLGLKSRTDALFQRLLEEDLKGRLMPEQAKIIEAWYEPAKIALAALDATVEELITKRHPMLLDTMQKLQELKGRIEAAEGNATIKVVKKLSNELRTLCGTLHAVYSWEETREERWRIDEGRRRSGHW